MIQVDLNLTIEADDDTEADELLKAIAALGARYPATPSVRLHEKGRGVLPEDA